ncbi:farnesyl cysteine-carboxyl methyltransferase [Tilletia horrida]|nr:farnesyl cysteine-carboxyl methyltransferase [Tilletia horrida]
MSSISSPTGSWSPPAHQSSSAPLSSPHSSSHAPRRTLLTPTATDSIPPHLSGAALTIALTSFGLGALASMTFFPSLLALLKQVMSAPISASESGFRIWPTLSCSSTSSALPSLPWQISQFGIYLGAWAIFHMLEFVITARYNPTRLFTDSFLLQNGIAYHMAHGGAVIEFLIEGLFFPCMKQPSALTFIGLALMLIGQSARSLAMVHAGNSFSHQVAAYKREDHVLVTTGIYSICRHPSYFGFFYWALGTQLMLANPVGTFVFAGVLYRFFSSRIRQEEIFLVRFFGKAYEDYRSRVPTLLPFI